MHHVRWRAQPERPASRVDDAREDEAAAVVADALTGSRERLAMAERAQLLDCYGIGFPAWELARDVAAAGAAASRMGGRMALKAEGPAVVHKTEIGAVRIGLTGAEEVTAAALAIDEDLARAGVQRESFVVQAMVENGVELLAGIVADPVFGPVLACGAGGIHAELLKDVQVRICPITGDEAAEMTRSLAIFPLLTGFRGAPEADVAALVNLLVRMSAMVEAHPEILELELNPVIVGAHGASVVDARVRVGAAPPPRPWPKTWK
jgi:acyl-CoA synthetase (NDP forming)